MAALAEREKGKVLRSLRFIFTHDFLLGSSQANTQARTEALTPVSARALSFSLQ